jgi:beta-RFAP synthase
MKRHVRVRAPCRLHFGMFSFGDEVQPQFGGVGLMIDPPALELTLTAADCFHVSGSLTERTLTFVEMAAERWKLPSLPSCRICVQSPSDHIGLGVGTQLGMSVAAGLRRYLNLPKLPAEALAADMGRGTRSAVGTHGFFHGGLIVDAGHRRGQPVGRLARRVAVPNEWRIVLIIPAGRCGLAGAPEADAFASLPPVPAEVTQQLWHITESEMLPALSRGECSRFGDAVYRFGRLAGECFSTVQGGPFANHETVNLVEAIRNYGISGVGQSSWGPTVFAICSSSAAAEVLIAWLRARCDANTYEYVVAAPYNSGARIEDYDD